MQVWCALDDETCVCRFCVVPPDMCVSLLDGAMTGFWTLNVSETCMAGACGIQLQHVLKSNSLAIRASLVSNVENPSLPVCTHLSQ